jgi:hypothetical protein
MRAGGLLVIATEFTFVPWRSFVSGKPVSQSLQCGYMSNLPPT